MSEKIQMKSKTMEEYLEVCKQGWISAWRTWSKDRYSEEYLSNFYESIHMPEDGIKTWNTLIQPMIDEGNVEFLQKIGVVE